VGRVFQNSTSPHSTTSPEIATLYLTEQGSVLRKQGNQLLVFKDGQKLLEVECIKLDSILIFGNVEFTTQALNELFEHGIEFALLTYDGELKGQLTPVTPKNVLLRLAQYQHTLDHAFVLAHSRRIVHAKMHNSLFVLRSYSYNRPELDLSAETAAIEQAMGQLGDAAEYHSLLGYEGAASRAYFAALAKLVPPDFGFAGRKRRPCPDGINALLSLGYAITETRIRSILDAIGFDPYLAFLHRPEYGRTSLALDLLEEFRQPLVDRTVLFYVNKAAFRPGDFRYDESYGGVLLHREPFKKFLLLFDKALRKQFANAGRTASFLEIFRTQAESLANHLSGNGTYTPFMLKKE